MNTKQKGDIAEQAVALEVLRRGWDVLKPLGDRLPYDLVAVVENQFLRLQVKASWEQPIGAWVIDHRRCKTNRQVNRIETYDPEDFDYAIGYIEPRNEFYVIPIGVLLEFGSTVTLHPSGEQRKPKAHRYLDGWDQFTTQSGALVARLAHNQQVTGSIPVSAIEEPIAGHLGGNVALPSSPLKGEA